MKIILTQEAADFMDEVTLACEGEVGGLGYCTADADGNITVDHVFLLPQEVSSASVDFDKDAILVALEQAAADGRVEDLRFSWHSHGNLGVYWSGTDEGAIRDYLNGGVPWLVSMVVNRKGERLGRVDVQQVPLAGRATFDKVNVLVARHDRTNGRAKREIKEFVREAPARVLMPFNGSWGHMPMSGGKGKGTREAGQREFATPKAQPIGLSEWEEQELRAAGHKPERMSNRQIDDALFELKFAPDDAA